MPIAYLGYIILALSVTVLPLGEGVNATFISELPVQAFLVLCAGFVGTILLRGGRIVLPLLLYTIATFPLGRYLMAVRDNLGHALRVGGEPSGATAWIGLGGLGLMYLTVLLEMGYDTDKLRQEKKREQASTRATKVEPDRTGEGGSAEPSSSESREESQPKHPL